VRKVEKVENPIRVAASVNGEVDAPAEEVWELLTDWAGVPRWWPQDAPVPIDRVTLDGKHGTVPRTRDVVIAGGSVVETLFLEDEKAMRIYYYLTDEGMAAIFGMPDSITFNYMATTTVDRTPEDRSRMSFSSTFDIPADADPDACRQRIEATYDAILEGFRRFFATPANQRPGPSYL
jgi:uncharacterized protein YndB with AHSA1/START domain